MTRAAKTLAQMKANPLDWRIESLKSVADAFGLVYRQPGGSHVIFRHPNGGMLSVPARRPIKPVYVRKFVRLVEEGVAE
ncbi:MAG: type II toxin-antitoxin system HicA family toxin [Betaproteobacteria bacterium]|nr:type II toxin-antitoxin system HicA family toxin [Betaproteobacteria bacterium]MBI2508636.1 type II toxin-antitoxin system HicA family toxin [Betaproteobacteria bacterium]